MYSWFTLLALIGAPAEAKAGDAAPDVVVVCPREFLPALQPWINYRARQGRVMAHVASDQTADEIRREIRQVAAERNLRWIVLVGDADGPKWPRRPNTIPAIHLPAKVNVKWGSEPEIATDNWYADLNDDDLPDVAIGRIPADSSADLTNIVRKILRYEESAGFGTWRQRINFVAGVGGFGALVDTVLEATTRKFLCDGIPAEYHTSMTYGSWRSPFCPDPRRFHEATVERLTEGCLFWVYIGHGAPTQLDRVQVPGGQYPILANADVRKLNGGRGAPIALMLACYTGAFDAPQDCIAEEMLRAEGGPVAVMAGSRVTMPYAMAVLGNGLIDECFRERRATLGEMFLHAKRRLMASDPDNANRQLMDAVAAAVSPARDMLVDERKEHLYLFNLLGDPLLGVRHPEPIALRELEDSESGATIEVQGRSAVTGRCLIELECRRDRFRFEPPARDKFESTPEFLAALHETYRRANDRRWTALEADLDTPGEFIVSLAIPAEATGPCVVKTHIVGTDQHGLGATTLFVRRPRPGSSVAK